MIKCDFPKCCQDCPHIHVTSVCHSFGSIGDDIIGTETEIYCCHRDLCKFYHPDEE